MYPFFAFLIRTSIAVPTAFLIWLISFFGFEQTFALSTVFALLGGGVTYITVKEMMNYRFLKKHGLTRKEYKFIKKNLEEARDKLKRLNKALFSVHSLPYLKQTFEAARLTRKIYQITKKEPKRFYLGEKFFYYHLDSLVELAEKYVFLSSQPAKNGELERSLSETRWLLDDLIKTIEKDLHHILSTDVEQLNFEIEMAKHNLKNVSYPQLNDESRRSK